MVQIGDGMGSARIDRRVVVRTGAGYAERVVADVEEIIAVPDGLSRRTGSVVAPWRIER